MGHGVWLRWVRGVLNEIYVTEYTWKTTPMIISALGTSSHALRTGMRLVPLLTRSGEKHLNDSSDFLCRPVIEVETLLIRCFSCVSTQRIDSSTWRPGSPPVVFGSLLQLWLIRRLARPERQYQRDGLQKVQRRYVTGLIPHICERWIAPRSLNGPDNTICLLKRINVIVIFTRAVEWVKNTYWRSSSPTPRRTSLSQ